MTDRTDHVHDASVWLEGAELPDLTPESTTALAAVAQAHATLALVEQQRIAYLIALAATGGQPVLDRAAKRALTYPNPEDHSDEIRSDIREALGL